MTPVIIAGTGGVAAAGTGATSTAGTSATMTAAAGGAGAAAAGPTRPLAGSTGASVAGSTASAGVGASVAGMGAAGAGSGGSAAGGGGAGGAGGTPGMQPMITTGTLPAIMDPAMPGPFKVKKTENTGPGKNYTMFEPTELGKDGIKHPILSWGPGAGAYPDVYAMLLNHIVTHGFVIISYNTTPQGPELSDGIDWIIEQSKTESSAYFNKLDTTKIAMGGQSAGSLATFAAGGDDRLTTTLHINGGSFNHADALNLKKPAFFICGDDPAKTGGDGTWESDLARPNCDADFMAAKVPVWYGVVIGSSHTTVIDNDPTGGMMMDPLKVHYLAATVAWLRWQLAGDDVMKALLVGADCGFCKQASVWEVKQRDLK